MNLIQNIANRCADRCEVSGPYGINAYLSKDCYDNCLEMARKGVRNPPEVIDWPMAQRFAVSEDSGVGLTSVITIVGLAALGCFISIRYMYNQQQ